MSDNVSLHAEGSTICGSWCPEICSYKLSYLGTLFDSKSAIRDKKMPVSQPLSETS